VLSDEELLRLYRSWEYIRNIIDTRNAGPIIAGLSMNTASESDLAKIHMASFPKDVPEDVRKDATVHIARAYDAGQGPVR